MRVILIEPDMAMSRSLQTSLRRQRFSIYATDRGEEGLELVRHYEHDLILLDLDIHDRNGLEVLRSLRSAKTCAPIVILSNDLSMQTKVRALALGADEYLTKPFHSDELIARIQAIIRRRHGHYQSEITTGMVTIDMSSRSVHVKGEPVRLSNMEYQILELLSLRKGAMLTKQVFIEHLYGDEEGPESRTVELFMCKLRRKLSKATGGVRYIETIGHRGYVLVDPHCAAPAAA